MNKKVSIIVPVYNAEKYLRECIESLICQSLSGLELIFINDASTDTSGQILQEYLYAYPERIKVFTLRNNSKQGTARNLGIKKAQGKYILFVDSDDQLKPEACELLYRKAESDNADIVFCDYEIFFDNIKEYCQHVQPVYLGELNVEKRRALLTTSVVPWAKLISKDLLTRNNIYFPEYVFYEDQATTYLYYLYAEKAVKLDEALYRYRLTDNSTSSKMNADIHFDQADMALLLVRRVWERGFYYSYQSELEYYLIEQMYCLCVESCFRKFENPPVKYLDRLLVYLNRFCPAYKENPYYVRYLSESRKKMIESHQKSTHNLISEYYSNRFVNYCPNYVYQLENNREIIKELILFLKRKNYRTALWGAGKYGRSILQCFKHYNYRFDYLVDSNCDLWGTEYEDYTVFSPVMIKKVNIVIIEFTNFAYAIRKEIGNLDTDVRTIDLELLIKHDLRLLHKDYLECE